MVLDAFSSDAIPIHLMTVEAIADELRTLEPDGVIAFHISNRYYDLSPAIAAALERLGLTTLERTSPPERHGRVDRHREPLAGRVADPERLAALRAKGWHAPLRPTTRSPTTTPISSAICTSASSRGCRRNQSPIRC